MTTRRPRRSRPARCNDLGGANPNAGATRSAVAAAMSDAAPIQPDSGNSCPVCQLVEIVILRIHRIYV